MMEKDGDGLPEDAMNDSAQDAEQGDLIPLADVLKDQVNIANGRV